MVYKCENCGEDDSFYQDTTITLEREDRVYVDCDGDATDTDYGEDSELTSDDGPVRCCECDAEATWFDDVEEEEDLPPTKQPTETWKQHFERIKQ